MVSITQPMPSNSFAILEGLEGGSRTPQRLLLHAFARRDEDGKTVFGPLGTARYLRSMYSSEPARHQVGKA